MRLLNYYEETIVDGPGLRFAFYFAGCVHACAGCHNVESWNPCAGNVLTEEWIEDIIEKINQNPYLDGITLSGGDPFFKPKELLGFLKIIKMKTSLPILVYTGYTITQLYADDEMKKCLYYIDMIMDGKFDKAKRFPIKPFRGSWNQRLLRIENGKMVEEI